jgi:hypothetical protein
MKAEFATLTYVGTYVDRNLLHKGIYSTEIPCVLEANTTIEDLINQAKIAKDMTGDLFVSDHYINCLQQCKISKISIELLT